MTQNDAVLHKLAGAVLDGIQIDWASAESSAVDKSTRRVVRDLKVIAEIAEVHGSVLQPETTAAETLPQTAQTWSGLCLMEKVGEGAFGEVYRAWDTRLDREVALKLLRRQDSEHSRVASAVIDEGRMLAQVRHPNIVTVHGADRSAGRVGLWMEFIHGRTLEQALSEQGPFGAGEATLIALDLCRALSAVHRAGLLHRDIKTHNVMREDGGRIVLMDFGTGLDRVDDSGDSARGLAGTPLYIAPEILEGQEASVRSDIYSVGVLLYHLLTRSYPVQGGSVQDVRDKHARGERTFLRDARPDLPETFVQVVERALAPRPEARYESAGATEAALASAREAAPPVSTTGANESLGEATEASRRAAAQGQGIVYWLICEARQIALTEGDNILGRDPNTVVWVDSPGVSRHHARIRIVGRAATLEDLGSKNGTYLRGELVTTATPLMDGDEIGLGSLVIRFRISPPAGSTETQPIE